MTTASSTYLSNLASRHSSDIDMPHILIVDDNEDLAQTFAMLFELHGYHVSTANNGDHALQITAEEPIDVLVTDFRMPGMNGQELIELMRADRPNLPAVIVSGFAGEIPKRDFKTKVLSKPVEMAALMGVVQEMLEKV